MVVQERVRDPDDTSEEHRNRAHFDYPIAIDTRLGGGMPPAQRLQRILRRRGELTAMILHEQSAALGALAWAYALVLAFALVYLGEHYVTDELAGLALAVAVNHAGRPFVRAAQALLDLGPRHPG